MVAQAVPEPPGQDGERDASAGRGRRRVRLRHCGILAQLVPPRPQRRLLPLARRVLAPPVVQRARPRRGGPLRRLHRRGHRGRRRAVCGQHQRPDHATQGAREGARIARGSKHTRAPGAPGAHGRGGVQAGDRAARGAGRGAAAGARADAVGAHRHATRRPGAGGHRGGAHAVLHAAGGGEPGGGRARAPRRHQGASCPPALHGARAA
mmetsp:Transcript_18500/g.46018  ORF Transcript_18500/g.46018 Transcript_18500/m.46018 type:complete len:208 (+) Transcript_18500:853-1476(+)